MSEEKEFKCQTCAKKYSNEELYIEHTRYCSLIGFSCKICGESLPSYSKANLHVKKCNGLTMERLKGLLAENALLRDIILKDPKKKGRYLKLKSTEVVDTRENGSSSNNSNGETSKTSPIENGHSFNDKAYDKFFFGDREILSKTIETKSKVEGAKDISEARLALLMHVEVKDYVDMIKAHHSSKKFVNKNFSPIEQKLGNLPGYHDSKLVVTYHDILLFRVGIQRHLYNLPLEPFSMEVFLSRYFNYSLAFYPIQDRLKDELKLLKNIVYINLPKKEVQGINKCSSLPSITSTSLVSSKEDDDFYSFYTFERIEDKGNGKMQRVWFMDPRLKDFVNKLISEITKYIIVVFRKLYYLIQNTNDYINDFLSDTKSTELMQLLTNFVWINDIPVVFSLVQNTIIQYNTLVVSNNPNIIDVTNMQSNNKIQRATYMKLLNTNTKEKTMSVLAKLFDAHDQDDIENLYKIIVTEMKL